MNLSDFLNDNPNPKVQEFEKVDEKTKEQTRQTAEDLVNKYKNMDSSSLMNEFIREVARQKQNGTFDKNKIINMLNSVKSFIPNDMYKKAVDILDKI